MNRSQKRRFKLVLQFPLRAARTGYCQWTEISYTTTNTNTSFNALLRCPKPNRSIIYNVHTTYRCIETKLAPKLKYNGYTFSRILLLAIIIGRIYKMRVETTSTHVSRTIDGARRRKTRLATDVIPAKSIFGSVPRWPEGRWRLCALFNDPILQSYPHFLKS
jgi:hypothetical protein